MSHTIGTGGVDCFICRPSPSPPKDEPWEWSFPRPLCGAHKRTVVLEDGQALEAVLKRAEPSDQPLEGGPLAWIYNPVYVSVEPGPRIRAWTDFAAGGMAVFEDRFAAESYFEFVALEVPDAVSFLYLVHLTGVDAASVRSQAELLRSLIPTATSEAHHWKGRDYGSGPWAGFERLTRTWNVAMRLGRVRSRVEHPWPESYAEVLAWLEACHPPGAYVNEQGRKVVNETGPDPETESAFVQSLCALVRRRFPE